MAFVKQRALAEKFRITTRQVRNLTDEGVLVRNSKLEYDEDDNWHRYLAYREEAARKRGGASKEEILSLQARRLEIEIEAAELALAQQRGQLVTLDYMESQVTSLLESLRARCLNMPGKIARDLADARTPAAVQDILEIAVAELLLSLSEAGDDPELDDDSDDASDGTERVAS